MLKFLILIHDEDLVGLDKDSPTIKFMISLSNDPAKWSIINSKTINFIIRNLSNKDVYKLDFSISKRLYSSEARYVRYVIRLNFFTKFKNGEMRRREWLIHFELKECLFCRSCKLFQPTPNTFTQWFNDWKNSDRHRRNLTFSLGRATLCLFYIKGNFIPSIPKLRIREGR